MTVLGHERQLTFFPSNGHNHDGENSSPVELLPGQVGLRHLDPALIAFLTGDDGAASDAASDGFVPVPDLLIETNAIGAGASITGTLDWTGICVVRFMRIYMSAETECTVTFYHLPTFAEEDREFRAHRCSNKFLWEGPWVHFDEAEAKKIYYKIENTGSTAARFQLVLKSGTLVANAYARFVASLQVMGSETAGFISNVLFEAGNGINIIPDEGSNSFKFEAVAPETITIDRYGEQPRLPTGVTSSTTLTYNTGGAANQTDNITTDYNRYATFGTGSQYIQYDYGAIYAASSINLILYFGDSRVVNAVKIDTSFDGINWVTVYGPTDTTGIGPPGIKVQIPSGLFTRYVRVFSNGSSANTSNHVVKCILYAQTNKVGS